MWPRRLPWPASRRTCLTGEVTGVAWYNIIIIIVGVVVLALWIGEDIVVKRRKRRGL